MMRGYARVSTNEQNPDLQVNALHDAGCDLVHIDEGVSGSTTQRPELGRFLDDLEDGDTLIVCTIRPTTRQRHTAQLE